MSNVTQAERSKGKPLLANSPEGGGSGGATVITDAEALEIAGAWRTGDLRDDVEIDRDRAPLRAFVADGRIDNDLLLRAAGSYSTTNDPRWRALLNYCFHRGPRGPVEGWGS